MKPFAFISYLVAFVCIIASVNHALRVGMEFNHACRYCIGYGAVGVIACLVGKAATLTHPEK